MTLVCFVGFLKVVCLVCFACITVLRVFAVMCFNFVIFSKVFKNLFCILLHIFLLLFSSVIKTTEGLILVFSFLVCTTPI